jgi:HAMP domain-containing protein
MGIRLKILSGFLILVFMLMIAGIWSIVELKSMGASVEKLLNDNYKSINAARLMADALERQDSAILLVLAGNRDKGIEMVENSNSAFLEAFKVAKNNVTIPGEDRSILAVEAAYDGYRKQYRAPNGQFFHGSNPAWYFEKVHPAFLGAKKSIEDLMTLNQKVMYETATGLHQRANRAIMPGVVAFVSALVFVFLFSYFINHYLVSPIIEITNALKQFQKTNRPIKLHLETKDELEELAEVLNHFTVDPER